MSRISAERCALIDARMTDWVMRDKYERMEWLIGDRNGVIHQGATCAPSVYRIYSMTKPVVSVIALQLIEEGRLHLFHPIAKFLPEFAAPYVFDRAGPRPAAGPITVQHLLTHTSGLSYGFMSDASGKMMNEQKVMADGTVSLRDDIKKIAKIPLQFDPGTRWLYSVATDVLGALIEVVEDAPLQDIVARRITDPLGMAETSFNPGVGVKPRLAPLRGGGIDASDGGVLDVLAYPLDDPTFARGGHGLFSTLGDYAKFAAALLGDCHGAGQLLSAHTLAAATQNHAAPVMPLQIELPPNSMNPGMNGQGFGLGFAVSQAGGPMISRPGAFGWSGAAETWFNVDPVADCYVVMMAQNFDWPGASFTLQNMMYGALRQT
ncbi:MAG: serine hydrolase domain-containing protein [Pikeienuella sp.]